MSNITKLQGCGNTFVLFDELKNGTIQNKRDYTIEIAQKENVDGVLFLNRLNNNLEMKIFDRDGTEETMCGNGIRCFARYAYDLCYIDETAEILTGDGIKKVEIPDDGLISVNMGIPRNFRELDENQYSIFMGIPHLIYFSQELDLEKARKVGRDTRYNQSLCDILGYPNGVSVNFVRLESQNKIKILTYEVGVEDITRACGTGSTASAYISYKVKGCKFPMKVENMGGDITINLNRKNLIMIGNAKYF